MEIQIRNPGMQSEDKRLRSCAGRFRGAPSMRGTLNAQWMGTAMVVLGIETTCDETAAAVVERPATGPGNILSNIVLSQINEHAAFGGVVPEIAARAHVEALDMIIARAMADAQCTFSGLDGVAAAAGPGLIGGVIVGLTTAKAIALVNEKPLMAVNHLEAHALTARLTDATPFPYCLFSPRRPHADRRGARRRQLRAARHHRRRRHRRGLRQDREAPRARLSRRATGREGGAHRQSRALYASAADGGTAARRFSLSGLKTALRLEAEKIAPLSDEDVRDLCASFQQSVVDVVADRLRIGLKLFREHHGKPTALVAAGGVAANEAIRKVLHRVAFEAGTVLVVPPPALCTDNGAMIAWAGAERLALGLTDTLATAPHARWPLSDVKGRPPPAGSATPTVETTDPIQTETSSQG